jgi:hypothetical protein
MDPRYSGLAKFDQGQSNTKRRGRASGPELRASRDNIAAQKSILDAGLHLPCLHLGG